MKYELYKRLYDNTITEPEFDLKELRMSFLSESDNEDISSDTTLPLFMNPVLYTVNGIRFLLGKEAIFPGLRNDTFSYLDYAYYYERNKQYRNALVVYDEAFARPGSTLLLKR
jgi:hypothetical protein